MRRAHTPPRVTAVVLNRLYGQTHSLEEALQQLAAGSRPPAPCGPEPLGSDSRRQAPPAPEPPASGPRQQPSGPAVPEPPPTGVPPPGLHQSAWLAPARPGDPGAYRRLLRDAVVAVSPDAPPLEGLQLRLSQRSTQEQARAGPPAGSRASPLATALPRRRAACGRGTPASHPRRRGRNRTPSLPSPLLPAALHRAAPQLVLQAIDVLVRSNRDNVLRYGFKKVRRRAACARKPGRQHGPHAAKARTSAGRTA
jgi:hypothetical protein